MKEGTKEEQDLDSMMFGGDPATGKMVAFLSSIKKNEGLTEVVPLDQNRAYNGLTGDGDRHVPKLLRIDKEGDEIHEIIEGYSIPKGTKPFFRRMYSRFRNLFYSPKTF